MIHILLLITLLVSACSPVENFTTPLDSTAQVESAQVQLLPDADKILACKILIVYVSRTKNTKALARMIQQYTSGKLMELELVNPYPENYKATVEQVARENETGFLPPLKTKIDRLQEYDVVFVGFPTWGMQLPPPMRSFLKKYDLGGKTVVPFNTNGGYGIGSSFNQVKQLCPNSTVAEGYSIKGGVERDRILFVMEGEKEKQARIDLQKWLQKINMVK